MEAPAPEANKSMNGAFDSAPSEPAGPKAGTSTLGATKATPKPAVQPKGEPAMKEDGDEDADPEPKSKSMASKFFSKA